jgi:hypothetical protein
VLPNVFAHFLNYILRDQLQYALRYALEIGSKYLYVFLKEELLTIAIRCQRLIFLLKLLVRFVDKLFLFSDRFEFFLQLTDKHIPFLNLFLKFVLGIGVRNVVHYLIEVVHDNLLQFIIMCQSIN